MSAVTYRTTPNGPRRIPPHLREEVRSQLDELVKQGVIQGAP